MVSMNNWRQFDGLLNPPPGRLSGVRRRPGPINPGLAFGWPWQERLSVSISTGGILRTFMGAIFLDSRMAAWQTRGSHVRRCEAASGVDTPYSYATSHEGRTSVLKRSSSCHSEEQGET